MNASQQAGILSGVWRMGALVVERRALKAEAFARLEPFKIKAVERVKGATGVGPRRDALAAADFNVLRLPADAVRLDLATDRGFGGLSSASWGAILQADESFGRSPPLASFHAAVAALMPNLAHVFPVHGPRAAGFLLAPRLGLSPDDDDGLIIPSNTAPYDLPNAACYGFPRAQLAPLLFDSALRLDSEEEFKGNVDLGRLAELLESQAELVPFVAVAVTSGALGGQPVSMANLRGVADLAKRHGKPLLIEASRFATNAAAIQEGEPGYEKKPLQAIVQEMLGYADGVLLSGTTDGLANVGGFLALGEELGRRPVAREPAIMADSEPGRGGLAGRDLASMAVGLREALRHETALSYRTYHLRRLAESLAEIAAASSSSGAGVLVGSFGLVLDAAAFLPHIPASGFPAVALANAFFLAGGVRGWPSLGPKAHLLLALPRRRYTTAHLDALLPAFAAVLRDLATLPAYKLLEDIKDDLLPFHAFARLQPLSTADKAASS